ncbi:WSC domain-containing protein [Colletotrichum truncatum]|uniref:WSC domain-containing protein n=1 Tax=Colletotrichum truncatum TaxID=5467 RepID=A0ACC3Z1B5_COLTU|nr:WSC domain-containing protein [Colletotrichum truncatum]KAF6800435.1 WSC domain-containing protein [Colletotrichum truncatum]
MGRNAPARLAAAILLALQTQTVAAIPFNGHARAVTKPPVNGYTYQGCYSEPSNGRALEAVTGDDAMTLEMCANICSASSKAYFGVEYGRECWCGSKLADSAVPAADESECSFACPGNSAENCGAGNRLNLYKNDDITIPQGPSAKAQAGNYISLGCYSDLVQGQRALSTVRADDAMTPDMCATFCAGSAYMGIEYGKECWCGRNLNTLSQLVKDETDCNMPCPGEKTSLCGGPSRLNLYSMNPSAAISSTSSAAASTPTDRVGDFIHRGCWTDERADGRTLSELNASDDMTIDMCATWAISKGYRYFGIEYSRECWAGNDLNPSSSSADFSSCNMRCAGNANDRCGGPDRLDLYSYSPAPLSTSSAEDLSVSSTSIVSSETGSSTELASMSASSDLDSSSSIGASSTLLADVSATSSESASSDFVSTTSIVTAQESTSSADASATSSDSTFSDIGSSALPAASSAPNDSTLPHTASAQLTDATPGDNAQIEQVDGKTVISLTPPVNGQATVTVPAAAAPDVRPGDSVVVQLTYKTDPTVTKKRAAKRAVLSECTLTMTVGGTVIYSNRIWTTDGSYTTVTSMPTSAGGLTTLIIVQYCPDTAVPIVIGDVGVASTPASSSSSSISGVIVSSTVIITSATASQSSTAFLAASVPQTTTTPTTTSVTWYSAQPYQSGACSRGTGSGGCILSGAPVATSGLLAAATPIPIAKNGDPTVAYELCARMCQNTVGCQSWALDRTVSDNAPEWKCYFYSGAIRSYAISYNGLYRDIVWFGSDCYACSPQEQVAYIPKSLSSSASSNTVNAVSVSSSPSSSSLPLVSSTAIVLSSTSSMVAANSIPKSSSASSISSTQPPVVPSSTRPQRPGVTPFWSIQTLSMPTTVTETSCPRPTSANWYEAGCILSGAPLQTSGLVAVATGIPAPPSSSNPNFEAAYQACAQMCASISTCKSWALDRGYWPADYSDWKCYFYSAGARIMAPQNQGQYWVVWNDKGCYDCPTPSVALLSPTPSQFSTASPIVSSTPASSTPVSSTAAVSTLNAVSSTAAAPTATQPPSEPYVFSVSAYTSGTCDPQPNNDGQTNCALSGWPTPTSMSGLLAVATGVPPVPSGVYDFSQPLEICAGACRSVAGCNTWVVDRGNWPVDLSNWSCYMYNFVNASNYYLPGNYFRLTTPGSDSRKYVWGVTECYNCTLSQAISSSRSSSIINGPSSTSIVFSSSPSSVVSATSGPSSTATAFATTSAAAAAATVTTFSAPPLLTSCKVPTAAQWYTNGCIQSGYPTATSALLAVATGIAPNAVGDYNFDPAYQRCGSICAGLTGCQGYALDRTNATAWNCSFYSAPVNALLRDLRPSIDYRPVVWMSSLCYNCPVPAPWPPAVSSSSSSGSSSSPASSSTVTIVGYAQTTLSSSSTVSIVSYSQSTASPSASVASVPTACVRASAPPATANCNIKGFREPANPTRATYVEQQVDCAAYCLGLGATCKSWAWVQTTGWCGVYGLAAWDAIGDSAVAGRAYKDNVMDEPGCWSCPDGVVVHYLPS